MEKFGIFELLDTLSAIIGSENGVPAAPEKKTEPSVTDSAFLPPDYTGAKTAESGKQALSSFLSRHDETVRKIGKKKE